MRSHMLRRICAMILCLALCFGMSAEVLAYTGVSNWAQEEVDAAEALGIIPPALEKKVLSGEMTRLEMCHMAVNTFEEITGTSLYPAKLNHFSDTKDADVCVAFELGIVDGLPDGTFLPDQNITRQEFAKIVDNLLTVLGWSEDNQTLGAFQDDVTVGAWAKEATARMVELGVVMGGSGKLSPQDSTSIEQACIMFLRAYNLLSSVEDGDLGGAADPVEGESGARAWAAEALKKLDLLDLLPEEEEYTPSYSGVSAWAAEALKKLDLLGLLPEFMVGAVVTEPITRGQMCEIAMTTYEALMQELPEVEEPMFSDTDLPAISQAGALKIVNGFTDGTFRPDELLTREQFFQITNNFLIACGYVEETDDALLQRVYADANSIGDWAKAPVALLCRMGIMQGNNHGCAAPLDSTTCEQAIAMLMRTYNQVAPWCESHPLKEIVGPLTSLSVSQQVVNLALSYVGYPYVWAGASPSVGFDCSGLIYYVYKQFGYNLYRAGDEMAKNGIEVEESDLQPGDIIIFSRKSDGGIQHLGLYVGDGMMVHAQSSKTGVVISRYDYDSSKFIYTIRRIVY